MDEINTIASKYDLIVIEDGHKVLERLKGKKVVI